MLKDEGADLLEKCLHRLACARLRDAEHPRLTHGRRLPLTAIPIAPALSQKPVHQPDVWQQALVSKGNADRGGRGLGKLERAAPLFLIASRPIHFALHALQHDLAQVFPDGGLTIEALLLKPDRDGPVKHIVAQAQQHEVCSSIA